MRTGIRSILALALLLVAGACARSGAAPGEPRRARTSADVITREEILASNQDNLYDVVRTLRFRWLQSRGPDTILGTPGEVRVHLDDSRLGGVEALRNLPLTGVAYIRFIDPVSAAARWGNGYSHGAIYVSTRAP